MPSPFPGMDPFVEGHFFGGIHSGLIHAFVSSLNKVLPPQFVASVDERVFLAESARSIFPDLFVRETREPYSSSGALTADPPEIVDLFDDERREPFIQIETVGDNARVVTVVEVLSPSNKTPGNGRTLYLQKQNEVLNSSTHLLEIDLLRSGQPTVAVPPAMLLRTGPPDYVACLHRAESHARFEYWPMSLRNRLARIFVPLADGYDDIVLDLQASFERAYDEGAFERKIDYRKDPQVPLSEVDAKWADDLLQSRGLR